VINNSLQSYHNQGADILSAFNTGWKSRFYILEKGLFKYFERSGAFNQGESMKGEANLIDYIEAVIDRNSDGRYLTLFIKDSIPNVGSSSHRTFRLRCDRPRDAYDLCLSFNEHIRYAQRPPRDPDDDDDEDY
jgi:hypothetical protein